MRRAFVISLLLHLLVISLFVEWGDYPAGKPSTASQGLSVALKPLLDKSVRKEVELNREGAKIPHGVRMLARESGTGQPIAVRTKPLRPDSARQLSPPIQHGERILDIMPGTDPALSPEAESEYRLRLTRALRQERVFQAENRGGRVDMHIVRRSGAAIPEVMLASSSGHAELDRLAIRSTKAVLAKVAAPGQSFRLSFVLDYRPDE